MDGVEIAGTDPANPWARAVLTSRRLATNHFTGWGYWIWFIPLKDGETSVGLVWDKRLVDARGAARRWRSSRDSSTTNPLSRQLIQGATPIEGDCRYYAHLPYFVDKFIGPGWAQVGDAGGFLDPFYSPGLDQMSFSVWTRTRLILKELGGAPADDMDEGVRGAQPLLRPLLQVLLRVDLPRQVLRHGRLRHHDDRVPPRHRALLLSPP